MYGTTRKFLDYFSLKSLSELPSLAELRDLSEIGKELELDLSDIPGIATALTPANDDEAVAAEEASTEAGLTDEAVSAADTADSDDVATLH
jgi:segregation and condensation protein B